MANKAARKMYDYQDVDQFMCAIGFVPTGEYDGDHKHYHHPILNLNYSAQRVTLTSQNDMSDRIRLAFLAYICCGQEFKKKRVNGDIVKIVERNFKDCQREPQKAFSYEQRTTFGIENDTDATMWILRRRADIINEHPEIQLKLPPIPKDWEKYIVEENQQEEQTTKNAQRARKSEYNWRAVNEYYSHYEENSGNDENDNDVAQTSDEEDDGFIN